MRKVANIAALKTHQGLGLYLLLCAFPLDVMVKTLVYSELSFAEGIRQSSPLPPPPRFSLPLPFLTASSLFASALTLSCIASLQPTCKL